MARDIGISQGTLSKLQAGKIRLTAFQAYKISLHLELEPRETLDLIASTFDENKRAPLAREMPS